MRAGRICPPLRCSEPYDRFVAEREGILAGLHAKATMIRDAFRCVRPG